MTEGLEIEEVKTSDREEIESLSEGIWDGWDYIPEVFDRWVKDGGFICVKKEGKIIGLAKHTWHSDEILWLEGLRVHPDHQGEGYGRKMIEAQMDFIRGSDHSAARFLTSGTKESVRKVAEDLGFELKKEYDYLKLDEEELEEIGLPKKEEVERVEIETKYRDVSDLVRSSVEIEDYEGLYIEGWTAYDIDDDLIKDRVEKGNCYSVRVEDEIEALMFTYVNEIYESMNVPFISGPKDEMKELLNFGIKEALTSGCRTFRVMTSSEKAVEAALDVGFKFSDHGSSVVYEKRVSVKKENKHEK